VGFGSKPDPDRVVHILGGLIANATKYGAPPVRVEAEPDGTSILIRVIDRGPGVPADLRARLFERFARSEQQKDSVQPGFGLGLATARELARAMHGDLWYEHDPGGDTAFCLRLRKAPSLRARTPTTPLQGIRPARRPA
jgi:signal transduction histidine kinase